MENEAIIERVADLIEQQRDLDLVEAQAELLRACATLAVTEIEGMTSALFAAGAVAALDVNFQGARNRYNEAAKIWGDDFRFDSGI